MAPRSQNDHSGFSRKFLKEVKNKVGGNRLKAACVRWWGGGKYGRGGSPTS